jgi:type VI secretion system protein ImpF
MKAFELSLLDRLIDNDSQSTSGGALRQASIDEIKAAVARDVEYLLNSRIAWADDDLDGLPNCQTSVLTCGVTDFVGMSLASARDRAVVCEAIERALQRHERRLQNVVVTLKAQPGDTQTLVFAIEALLVIYPLQEPVSFDALMAPMTGQYSVRKGRSSGIRNG